MGDASGRGLRRIAALAPLAVPLAALPALAVAEPVPGTLPGRARDAAPSAGPLTLACTGVAVNPLGFGGHPAHRTKAKSHASDDGGDDDAAATHPQDTRGGTAVDFVFEFAGDSARVLYPAAIVPTMHSGGDHGWWPIRDLGVSDAAFTGHVALNFVNHASFTIDRRTGTLTLRGLQANVAGRCAKVDPTRRLF